MWDNKFIEHKFTIRKDLKDSFCGQFVRGAGFGANPDRTEENLYKANTPLNQHASINRIFQKEL